MKIKHLLYLSVIILSSSLIKAQDFFTVINERDISTDSKSRTVQPEKYLTYKLNVEDLKAYIKSVPQLSDMDSKENASIIVLPMPNGTKARFKIWKSSVMENELAAKFPNIVTFTGQGVDDRYATVKLDFTELGFHAQIKSVVTGDLYIDPYAQNDNTHYVVYKKQDLTNKHVSSCGVQDDQHTEKKSEQKSVTPSVGNQIRIFRLAVACTGEYAIAATGNPSPTVAQTLSAIVTTVNRVNGVYEQDLAVRLILVANQASIVFTNPSTDPFTGNNDAYTLINESQANIDAYIGNANYDIGHTFSTGGGGLAGLGVICNNSSKGSGITGSPFPVGDPYDIDYVAHEIGHQFGGPHTFNATTGSCNGNRSAANAVEPGSGVTIMAYAGICGSTNDLANNSIAIFHTRSFQSITTKVQSTFCQVTTPVSNTAPVVNAGSDYTIPVNTPFKLTGSATDAQSNALTYCWEQNDTGPAGNWNAPTGNAPLFRSYLPTTVPHRYFPRLQDVLNNQVTIGEFWPNYARTMEFRLTVRDNNAGCGGVTNDDVIITVNGNSGPFRVTSPSTAVSWAGNSSQTVTWNVANTTLAPVNCANVSILLSTDGGLTYPITILASTPNDGSQVITVPNVNTSQARIMVASVGNVFYHINPATFSITQTLSVDEASKDDDVFVIYPNPSKGILNVKFTKQNDNHDITVYDMSGKLVFRKLNNTVNKERIATYNLSSLIKGEYMISIKSKTIDRSIKWIKE
ncbi:reprolysin-like metallopeptidase [Chryseobacterium taihuense]|uniref:Por secretion system C-terminal sorting domain-containing protein n=1 Tax=Chryseobacterium taihuense TaxID=1141221 RepID=A0ABY0QNZ1_9FLAO|nr:zinc-dependent metalloprotease family protein [Chryseobacterium taihuense]SDL41365.1 Por secretion system C-terminal sorting domain-containing protein [Chryseobacterium taihuense]